MQQFQFHKIPVDIKSFNTKYKNSFTAAVTKNGQQMADKQDIPEMNG